MLQAQQIALIDGKPVYKDCDGKLCIEDINFSCLRQLTAEEQKRLSKALKVVTSLVEKRGGDV